MLTRTRFLGTLVKSAAIAGLLTALNVQAQSMSGQAIVTAMQKGGYTLAMTNARAPEPEAQPAAAGGGRAGRGGGGARGGGRGGRGGFGGFGGRGFGGPPGRQLDDYGMGTMTGMRYAFRQFKIPVGRVLYGPSRPTMQTADALAFGQREEHEELGEDMAAQDADWLRMQVAHGPMDGTDTVIVTHAKNLEEAFGNAASNLKDGEGLLIDPEGKVVGRIEIEEWSKLAVG